MQQSKGGRGRRCDSPSNQGANLASGGGDAMACGADVGGENLTGQQPGSCVGAKLACSKPSNHVNEGQQAPAEVDFAQIAY